MRIWLPRLIVGIPSAILFFFTAPILAQEDIPDSLKWWREQVGDVGGESLQAAIWILAAIGILVAILWSRLLPAPRLVGGEFVEFTRNAVGGSNLQVLGVEIFNNHEAGGERRTARGVVPELTAFSLEGKPVAQCPGNWFPDRQGLVPATVDFRPTRERHSVELAGKFPDSSDAWLAGEQDPPSLKPGIYKVQVTLRGGNLRRPRRLKCFIHNPGTGERLSAARKKEDVALPERSSSAEIALLTTTDVESTSVATTQTVVTIGEPMPEQEQEKPFDPTVDPIAKIDALLEEAGELARQLWERHKTLKRSGTLGLPGLGGELVGNVRAWNEKVLALADEYLPLREAANVDALPGWTSAFANTQRMDNLLSDNSLVLMRIRQIVEAREQSR